MNPQKRFDGLDFDQDLFLDPNVDPIRGINLESVVHDREGNLRFDEHSDFLNFVHEASMVRTFKQARAKRGVHFERAPKNLPRDFVNIHSSLLFLRFLSGKGRVARGRRGWC